MFIRSVRVLAGSGDTQSAPSRRKRLEELRSVGIQGIERSWYNEKVQKKKARLTYDTMVLSLAGVYCGPSPQASSHAHMIEQQRSQTLPE